MKLNLKMIVALGVYAVAGVFALLFLGSFWLAGPGYVKDGYDVVRVSADQYPSRARVGDHLICTGPLSATGEHWRADGKVVKRASEITLTPALAQRKLTCSLADAGKIRTSVPIELAPERSLKDRAGRWVVSRFGEQLAVLVLALTAPIWIGGALFAAHSSTQTVNRPAREQGPTRPGARKLTTKPCPNKKCHNGIHSASKGPDRTCAMCGGLGKIAVHE